VACIVMGLGNTLNRDEGLGVHALDLLESHLGTQDKIEFVDGGTLGLNLLPLVESCSHLLLLDAVNAGQAPGTVVELAREQIPLFSGIKMSQHQVTFQEVLALARFRGKLPEHLHLVGAQPVDTSIGLEVSPAIRDMMPNMLERAEAILAMWGLLERTPQTTG
jgi:hydrogenase maturation protease